MVEAFGKVIEMSNMAGIKTLLIEAADERSHDFYKKLGFTSLDESRKFNMYIAVETLLVPTADI